MLSALRWDAPGSPVRVISFDRAAVKRLGLLLPALERTFLIENELGRWATAGSSTAYAPSARTWC